MNLNLQANPLERCIRLTTASTVALPYPRPSRATAYHYNLLRLLQLSRGQGCSLFAATPTTRKEPMQPTRQAPQRLGPPDRPGRRTTSAVFSPKEGPSPAAASLLLLCAGDIETHLGPHCYACGNPVRHDTSPLRCSPTNCRTVSHKQFTCSGLHRSNLLNRWQ